MAPPHPLRRISTGSLSSLARSQDRAHAPSDLDFIEPALTELVDEAATLASNVQRLNTLHDALGTFNEGFAAYLYAIKMNAFCVAWPEAPDEKTWSRLPELTAREPEPEPVPTTSAADQTLSPKSSAMLDMTYATVYSVDDGPRSPSRRGGRGAARGTGIRRPAPGAAAAAKRANLAAKKKRELEISRIIDTQLPLEYRGGDSNTRICMEKVIERLMEDTGLAIGDMVKPPDMPHPKVNKCLIALVAKKLVVKSSAKGKTLYDWVGQ